MTTQISPSIFDGYKKRRQRYIGVTIILCIAMFLIGILSLIYGDTVYSLNEVVRVLKGETIKGVSFAIGTIRVPRVLCGMLAGISFGVAGNTFQTMLRNPLASPDIIGITSGCSVMAVFCILMLGLSGSIVSISALISGLLISTLIYLLSRKNGFSGGRLVLIGIGVQAFINSIISYILLRSNEYEISSAIRWLNGSLNASTMKPVGTLLTIVIIFVLLNLLFTKELQALELGDEFATTLGVRVNIMRIALIITSVVLIAYATSVTGPISFVAFLSGPIATQLVGKGSPRVLASGFVGAILVLLADFIGQNLFSSRFPVGVITGLIGGPYMLYLLIKKNKKGTL